MKTCTVRTKSIYDTESVARLVQTAGGFKSNIYLIYENKTANAKSIMGLLSLGLTDGHEVLIQAEGEDEDAAALGITEVLTPTSVVEGVNHY